MDTAGDKTQFVHPLSQAELNGAKSNSHGPRLHILPFALVEAKQLKPHEQTDSGHLETLIKQIKDDGMLYCPILIDKNHFIILDGHHRVLALKYLGCSFIPSYLVDYWDPLVLVNRWERATSTKVNKDEIIKAGLTGRLFPPKTSRHCVEYQLARRPVPLSILSSLGDS